MPEVGLNREFLHRSCVQLSASLADTAAVEVERQHALRFVRLHAADHVGEVARALVWRVADTDDDNVADRAGAWALLTAALLECGDSNNDLSRTALASKLLLFLPYLIAHRWYTRVVASSSTRAATHDDDDEDEEELKERGGRQHEHDNNDNDNDDNDNNTAPPRTRRRPRVHLDTSGYGKVVPAAVINGSSSSSRYGAVASGDAYVAHAYTRLYHGLLASWKAVWRDDVYASLKAAVRAVERHGRQTLSAKASEYLAIPATFRDSLWRLRRRSPRPSIALHMLYCYGWPPQTLPSGGGNNNNNNLVRPKTLLLPTSMNDVRALDAAMHPGALTWLRKLVDCKGGCRLCDTWRHVEARCPCELPFVRNADDDSNIGNHDNSNSSAGAAAAARARMRRVGDASSALLLSAAATSSSSAMLIASPSTPLLLLSPLTCDASAAASTLTPLTAVSLSSSSSSTAASLSSSSSSSRTVVSTLSYTFLDAMAKLHRHGLSLPLRIDDALDRITQLIQAEQPYEELLRAFDVVRGAVTGPRERHALWLHASYHLLPSATVFGKPSDDALSPTLARAEAHFKTHRRYREWDALLQSVDALDTPLRRRRLPAALRRCLDEVRETNSFFFCLVDGSLPAAYTPARYARVPDEVVALAPYKDVLCRLCLEPFHVAAHCPQYTTRPRDGDDDNKHNDDNEEEVTSRGVTGDAAAAASGHRQHHDDDDDDVATHRQHSSASSAASGVVYVEPWDVQVARVVLADNHLTSLRLPDEAYRLDDALRRIDADDRQAKAFRKYELTLAVRLVHERHLPLCSVCHVIGHSVRVCEVHARRVLAREALHPVDVCLTPSLVHERVRRHRAKQRDGDARELQAAFALLYRGVRRYPSSYATAMRELADACVPLAAARYSTDAVQGFLLFINSSDLLTHLLPLRDAAFPEVCLFCDSCHHLSEDCRLARDEEAGFVRELRQCGLDVWSYLRAHDYYDERLPSDFVHGRESVLRLVQQFTEDYGPGGVARRKFIEHNGLDHTAAATQGSGFVVLGTTAADAAAAAAAEATAATMSSSSAAAATATSKDVYAASSTAASPPPPLRASPYGMRFSQLVAPSSTTATTTTTMSASAGTSQDAAAAHANNNDNTSHRYALPAASDDGSNNDDAVAMMTTSTRTTAADDGTLSRRKRTRDDDDDASDDAGVREGNKLQQFLLAGMLAPSRNDSRVADSRDDTRNDDDDEGNTATSTHTAAAAAAAVASDDAIGAGAHGHSGASNNNNNNNKSSLTRSVDEVASATGTRNGHAPRTLRLFATTATTSSSSSSNDDAAIARQQQQQYTLPAEEQAPHEGGGDAVTATASHDAVVV